MHKKEHGGKIFTIWGMAAAVVAALIGVMLTSGSNAAPVARTEAGVASCQVDASGYCTLPHTLGVVPSAAEFQPTRIGQLANADNSFYTATTVRPRFWWHNGSLFAAGTTITFNYVITAAGTPATTPPPTTPPPSTPPTTPPPTTPPTTPPDPGTSPVLACTSPTFTTTSTDNNGDGRTVSGPGGPYFIHNNMWNNHSGAGPTGTYRMDLCDPYDNWKETWTQQPSTVSPGAVRAYPNIHKDYADIPVTDVYAARFAHNTTKVSGHVWNVAFDSWITCGGNDFGGELMIWTENHNQTPAGTRLTDADQNPGNGTSSTMTIGGQAYEVWKSGGQTSQCGIFSYRSVNTQTHGTMPLQEFYNDLKRRGWIPSNATTWQVDYGIETVSTADQTLVTNFNDFEIFDVTNPGSFASVPTSQRFSAEQEFETKHPGQKVRDAHRYQQAKGWR